MRKYINTNWLFYCVLFVILSSIVQTFGKPRGEDDDGERESEIVHEQQLEATGSGEHVDIHHEEYT